MELGSPYFVLLSIGFCFGCVFFVRIGERLGAKRVALIDICIAAIVGGMVGSRLLHVVAEPLPEYTLDAPETAQLAEDVAKAKEGGDAALAEALEPVLAESPVYSVWAFIAQMPPGEARAEAIACAVRDPTAVPARLWYRARPAELLQFWKGGLAWWGGLVLAVILGVIVAYRHGESVWDLADVSAPSVILGLIFGRVGCFLGGCCYGQECPAAWWSASPSWYPPHVGAIPRYPTALLTAAFALVLFGVLWWLLRRRAVTGEVFAAMFVLYAPGRFLLEVIRADPRGGAGGLSTSQLGVILTGVPALLAWIGLRLWAPRLASPEGTAKVGEVPPASSPDDEAPLDGGDAAPAEP